jgi:hypothetical protein
LDDAGFFVGAALAALDPLARDDHPLGRLWRQRLALRSAAVLIRLGRGADETTLRDAWYLTRPGDDPGPAGRLYGAFRALGEPWALRPQDGAARLPTLFDISAEDAAQVTTVCTMGSGGNPVRGAAAIAADVAQLTAGLRSLAIWCADATLAQALGWPAPVPLLACALRSVDERHLREGSNWTAACQAAYARAAAMAIDLYIDLRRRTERLLQIAPKLRGKDATSIVARLLSEDASAAVAGRIASDRSARRLFERLVEFGVVRELTGRSTFRLYGL